MLNNGCEWISKKQLMILLFTQFYQYICKHIRTHINTLAKINSKSAVNSIKFSGLWHSKIGFSKKC